MRKSSDNARKTESLGEAEIVKMAQRRTIDPDTGVGSPRGIPEAAGAELGGDTGDVDTPRDQQAGPLDMPHGALIATEASTVVHGGPRLTLSRQRKRRAG